MIVTVIMKRVPRWHLGKLNEFRHHNIFININDLMQMNKNQNMLGFFAFHVINFCNCLYFHRFINSREYEQLSYAHTARKLYLMCSIQNSVYVFNTLKIFCYLESLFIKSIQQRCCYLESLCIQLIDLAHITTNSPCVESMQLIHL